MQGTSRERLQRNILLVALFCTAFSSLVYELVWCRELSYVFGSTALAASSVLAIFMGGLALGSLYAGRILESRSKPFRFLAKLQCGLGITCILTLFAIKGVYKLQPYLLNLASEHATSGIKIILFLLACCILIAPMFLIGVAFPCIVQLYHAKHGLVGQSVSRCYWIDTLGASLGMLLGAFALVPTLGFFRTSLAASMLNVLAGILLFLSFHKADDGVERPATTPVLPTTEPSKQLSVKIISFLFFLSGFAALVLEVTWIRHWGLIYGSGLHAFAIVVITFLLGLSFGSLLYDIFLKKIQNQVLLFSAIELLLGAIAVVTTALFPHMESVFLKIYFGTDNYYVFIISLGLLCFALLLVPTTLMGMTLPTLCAINVSDRHIGKDFGKLYAVNALGALVGSFCAGFTIIPALGIYHTSLLAGGVYVFIAFAFLYCFSDSRPLLRRTATVFIGIVTLTAAAFAGLHMPDHLYNGVFYTGIAYKKQDYHLFFERKERALRFLRFLKNGMYGQVTVTGPRGGLLLRTNGKIDSGTAPDLASYQTMLGHIPVIIHEKPSNILNIGLGFGWTMGAIVSHPIIKSADCVEINPLIVEVNKNVCHSYNGDVLNNPKVRTIINDGRNYVAHTKKIYDVIISEPTDLSSSGISALLTKEFYISARKALNKGGILCQWFPRYEVAERDYKTALNTIKHIFPYAYEFDMAKITNDEYNKSFLIMASQEPIDINKRLQQRKSQCQSDPNEYHSYLQPIIEITQESFSRDNEALEALIADVHQLNTDDLPVLEFHALRDRFRKFRKE
ncbi:MAG: fused MFS/spermidine synthase [Planctomycetota bacterium]|jgi:spermidine synthase